MSCDTNLIERPRVSIWKRRFVLLGCCWAIVTFALSFSAARAILAYPLCLHDKDASAEKAYVMADGGAYWERLRAASDLYHQNQVQQIVILEEERIDGFDFVSSSLESRRARAISYLGWLGVPEESISSVPVNNSTWLGSLSEARGIAEQFPELTSIVVVTSAAHTRRSKLSFQRAMPNATIQVYAASDPHHSIEIHCPLWMEYCKLVLYFFVA